MSSSSYAQGFDHPAWSSVEMTKANDGLIYSLILGVRVNIWSGIQGMYEHDVPDEMFEKNAGQRVGIWLVDFQTIA